MRLVKLLIIVLSVLTEVSDLNAQNQLAKSAKSEVVNKLSMSLLLRRALLIGETTGGGAHPVSPHLISNGFIGNIPYTCAINPVTQTNWEGVGVKPDVIVSPADAIETALVNNKKETMNLSK